jgi:hypothetical protein
VLRLRHGYLATKVGISGLLLAIDTTVFVTSRLPSQPASDRTSRA